MERRQSLRLVEKQIWEDQITRESETKPVEIVQRHTSLFPENLPNCTEYTDFSIIPDILLFPTPYDDECDFDLPTEWKQYDEILNTYKTIQANYYRAPVQRVQLCADNVPTCSCKKDTGCDENCENKQLYM